MFNKIKALIQIRLERIKLNFLAFFAQLLSHLVVLLILGILGIFFLFFLSITLGYYLNEIFESTFIGFLLVSGCYFLIFIIIYLRKGKIYQSIERTILQAYDKVSEEDED